MALDIMHYKRPEGVEGPEHSPDYAKDAVFAERWTFGLNASYGDDEVTLRLRAYAKLTRPTRRSKWRPEREGWKGSFWTAFNTRESGISIEHVPFPEGLIAEAIAAVRITFEHPESRP